MSVLDKTLLTTVGAAKYAYNDANTLPTQFAEIALGDNNGAAFIPSITDGDCVNEVYRANINSITIDPSDSTIVILQLVLPAAVGGFTVREARVYDADGVVMYTANPYFIKSIDSSDQNLLFRIKRSATSNVTLLVDPSITLASHTYVLNALEDYATKVGVQTNIYNHVTAGGTANAITAAYSPAYAAWADGMTFFVKITAANTSTTPTVSPNGLTAKTIVKTGGTALVAGNLSIGMIAEFKYSATLDKVLLQNPDESSALVPVGTVFSYSGSSSVAPTGYIFDGAVLSRTTYAALFKLWVTDQGFTAQTFTVTIASPGVFTKNSHGFTNGERLRLSTTGALPTGLNTTTDYFVEVINSNSFYLTTSIFGVATRINTSGTQSGTHSYTQSLYGLGDGSTTFNAPDLRGLFLRGLDRSRGIDTNRTMGTTQKGTLNTFDTYSTGVGTDAALFTVAVIGNPSSTFSQQSVGADGYILTDYNSNIIALWNSAVNGVALSTGTGGTGFTTGVTRPSNIALPFIIKY